MFAAVVAAAAAAAGRLSFLTWASSCGHRPHTLCSLFRFYEASSCVCSQKEIGGRKALPQWIILLCLQGSESLM